MAGEREPDEHVAAARAGDRAATERVLRSVFPRVLRTCRGIFGGRPEAEDAAQEALVEIAKALSRYRGEGSIGGYATRITVRTAMRLRKRSSQPAEILDEELEGAHASPSAHDDLMGMRRTELVRELLDRLPSEQAETVALRIVLGHTLKEVSEITETPQNTVRSRLRLAKEAMSRAIEADPRLRELVEADR
jgi:RNA polymerase sigma-70 factor (ECF subfamily)